MIEYNIQYKCRRCGETHGNMMTSNEKIAKMSVLQITIPEVWKKEWGLKPYMNDFHNCKDGGFGVSDFIGVNAKEQI